MAAGPCKSWPTDVVPGGSTAQPSRLGQMRKFALDFDENEAQRLAQRKRQDGKPLTWSYVERVLPARDHKKQLSLIEKCLRENMTPNGLTALVQKQEGGKRSSGGRTPTCPKSVEQALRTTVILADRFRRWCQALEPNEKAAS